MALQYFNLDRLDFYRFVNKDRFEFYLKEMLQTDVDFDENDSRAGNFTFVIVHQNGERQLKVFPWNQILLRTSERNDLVGVFLDLYGHEIHDLCYTNVNFDKNVDLEDVLQEFVDFLTQMESQKFYPVIVTISQSHVNIISLS